MADNSLFDENLYTKDELDALSSESWGKIAPAPSSATTPQKKSPPVSVSSQPQGTLKNGTVLGKYKIVEFLSRAGVGETYRGEHTLTGTEIVMKVLPKVLSRDEEFLKRFKSESGILKGLSHSRIVKVHDLIQDMGFVCIIMEYVSPPEGEPSNIEEELIEKGRLPADEVKRIALQVCSAIHFAHHYGPGIIHSDLKPANILFDHDRNIKISNFALMHLVGHVFFRNLIKLTISQNFKEKTAEIIPQEVSEIESPKEESDVPEIPDPFDLDEEPEPEESTKEKAAEKQKEGPSSEEAEDLPIKESEVEKTASFVLLTPEQNIGFLDFGQVKFLGSEYLRSLIKNSARLGLSEGDAKMDSSILRDGMMSVSDKNGERTNSILSTYDYMSPEQKTGEPPTERSNIYSIGLLLYRMLTGRKMVGNWELPSSFGCSSEWDEIIIKCLRTHPEERYASVAELARNISKVGRRRILLITAAIAACICVSILFVAFYLLGTLHGESGLDMNRIMEQMTPKGIKTHDNAQKKNSTQETFRETELRIHAQPPGTNLELYKNGEPIKAFPNTTNAPVTLTLQTGTYTLMAEKAGYRPITTYLALTEDPMDLSLHLTPQPPTLAKNTTLEKPILGQPWIIPELKMQLAPIPSGELLLLLKDPKDPQKTIEKTIVFDAPFWMGRHEVTQFQFDDIIWKRPAYFTMAGEMGPVECVTSQAAKLFCDKLTKREKSAGRLPEGYVYRLPTETEWEYCCRSGTRSDYNFGNDAEALDQFAWHAYNSLGKTHPVGQKSPNTWGLYDTHGNVWEWCLPSDYYNPSKKQKKPVLMVLKGGCWHNPKLYLKCSNRFIVDSAKFKNNKTGFRVVLAPKPNS